MDALEVAAAVIEPHFDAVRDVFVEFEPEPELQLDMLKRTRLVVDPEVHDTPRHFAMCRDDGLLIKIAPEAATLDLGTLTAIISHEFGHAADFAYPGRWVATRGRPAVWVGEAGRWRQSPGGRSIWEPASGKEAKRIRRFQRLWHERTDDQVEWAADSIAFAVTGVKIRYCGDCMLQCFGQPARERPRGLR